MKKKNILKGAFALALVTLIGGTVVSASAASLKRADYMDKNEYKPQLTEEEREERRAEREERREAVREALNNANYEAWLEATGENHPLAEKITQDNFSKLVEAHQLREQVHQIMQELGVDKGEFGEKRFKHKRFNGR